jgi:hypothetical protein
MWLASQFPFCGSRISSRIFADIFSVRREVDSIKGVPCCFIGRSSASILYQELARAAYLFQFQIETIICRPRLASPRLASPRLALLQHCLRLVFASLFYLEMELLFGRRSGRNCANRFQA